MKASDLKKRKAALKGGEPRAASWKGSVGEKKESHPPPSPDPQLLNFHKEECFAFVNNDWETRHKKNVVPVLQAFEEHTMRIRRRQKQRVVTALCHSQYSPEKKRAVRKRSIELERKRRAEMSDEKRNLIRKKDREHKARRRLECQLGKPKGALDPAPPTDGCYWWQLEGSIDFSLNHRRSECYLNVIQNHTDQEVHTCGRCGQHFWRMFDQMNHEHGLVGNYGTTKRPRLVLINTPCGNQDPGLSEALFDFRASAHCLKPKEDILKMVAEKLASGEFGQEDRRYSQFYMRVCNFYDKIREDDLGL